MNRFPYAGRPQSGGIGIQVLNKSELEEIHRATLEVLWDTGIYVQVPEAQELFKKAGARVDDRGVVHIPPHVVEDAISSAPSKVIMRGRTPERDLVIEGRRVNFTNFGDAVKITDPYTGERRPTTKKDLADMGRLSDALDIIKMIQEPAVATDVPEATVSLHNYEALVLNTEKHITMGPYDKHDTELVIEMARAVARVCRKDADVHDECLPISLVTCPVSPLRLVHTTCEVIMAAARNNIPNLILSMAMSGGSTSVHLAGTLVSHNAEVLGGITLNQLTRKGSQVIYGSSTTSMDLRTATAVVGSPELAMISAAVGNLAQFYGIPSWTAGG